MRARRAWLLIALSATTSGVLLASGAAHAGEWAVASCVNPNGSAAGSEGWTGAAGGGTGYGSNNGTSCAPGTPMYAVLSSSAAAPVGAFERLQFAPAGTSTLIGGSLSVAFRADGGGYDASGTAVAYTPEYAYDGSNVFFQCAAGLTPCANGTNDFTGTLELPTGRGGSLFVAAGCGGEAGESCDSGGSEGAWSLVRLYSAELLMENDSTPTASGFSGALLEPDAHGTASLQFTASDPDGPGVYIITVQIDGSTVYQGTPNGNDGHCASVGTFDGAPVFDYLQPCEESETLAIPVNTAPLSDGPHTLTVTVTDAAENSSTVYDGTITTANRTTVSALLDSPPQSGVTASQYAIVLSKHTAKRIKHLTRSFDASAVRLGGQLLSTAGTPAPGVTVSLTAQDGNHPAGAVRVLAQTSTNAAGDWSLRAGKGPSRRLRVVYGADPTAATAGQGISIGEHVRPSLSMNVSSPGTGRIVFTGHMGIKPLGSPRPLVTIQTRAGKTWEAVGLPVHVSAKGAFRYVFQSSP